MESATSVYRNDAAVARLHAMYRQLGRRGLGGAKNHAKERAHAEGAFDLDLASHPLDQTLDDGQPKSVAVDVTRLGALLAKELLEHLGQILGTDADP